MPEAITSKSRFTGMAFGSAPARRQYEHATCSASASITITSPSSPRRQCKRIGVRDEGPTSLQMFFEKPLSQAQRRPPASCRFEVPGLVTWSGGKVCRGSTGQSQRASSHFTADSSLRTANIPNPISPLFGPRYVQSPVPYSIMRRSTCVDRSHRFETVAVSSALRKAFRRIGQSEPVQVVFMAYWNTPDRRPEARGAEAPELARRREGAARGRPRRLRGRRRRPDARSGAQDRRGRGGRRLGRVGLRAGPAGRGGGRDAAGRRGLARAGSPSRSRSGPRWPPRPSWNRGRQRMLFSWAEFMAGSRRSR